MMKGGGTVCTGGSARLLFRQRPDISSGRQWDTGQSQELSLHEIHPVGTSTFSM